MPLPSDVAVLLEQQHGVVSRQQLLAAGLGRGWVAHRVRRGGWRTLHPGVYITHDGPLEHLARAWAALLHAGEGAVVSHATAGFLQGLVDDEPAAVHVSVTATHRVTARAGVVLHRRRHQATMRHPARSVPQTSLEQTVLDLVEVAIEQDDVVGWLTRACQRRLTTPQRLEAAAADRPRLRHRVTVRQVLTDVSEGVASPLERRYARDVERRHGLPRGTRNELRLVAGRSTYSDVRYRSTRVRVELEGLAYHPADRRALDDARDNAAALVGDVVLRYGWRAVVGSPCRVAAEVARLMQARGWCGSPRPCGPGCVVRTARAA